MQRQWLTIHSFKLFAVDMAVSVRRSELCPNQLVFQTPSAFSESPSSRWYVQKKKPQHNNLQFVGQQRSNAVLK